MNSPHFSRNMMNRGGRVTGRPMIGQIYFDNWHHDNNDADSDDDDDNNGVFIINMNQTHPSQASTAIGSRVQFYTSSPVGSRTQLNTAPPLGPRIQLNTASPVASRTQLNTTSPVGSRTHLHVMCPAGSRTQLHTASPMGSRTQLHMICPVSSGMQHYAASPVRSKIQLYRASPFQSQTNLSARNASNLEQLLNLEHSSIHEECKKLEKSNFRMQVLFYVLVAACILMLMLYVGLIAFLINEWPEAASKPSFCLESEKVKDFMDIWAREDKHQIRALMKEGNYMYAHNPAVGNVHCFGNLTWVPKVMGEISTAVQESLDYIGNNQLKINKSVHTLLMNDQRTQQTCVTGNTGEHNEIVFVHYFLNTSATYKGNGKNAIGILKWASPTPDSQAKGSLGIDVNTASGEFTIVHSGFYYVYSYVTFHSDVKNAAHYVMRKTANTTKILLSSTLVPYSNLQGMFELWRDDTLSVHAATEHVSTVLKKSTYFGAYLIRSG